MKRLALLTILLSLSSAGLSDVLFTVAYENKTQFPYYIGEGSTVPQTNPGAAVELVSMLEGKIDGLKVKFQRYPWKRCLSSLEKGTVDGIFNASYKEKRLKFGNYPTKDNEVDPEQRLTTISYSFYRNPGSSFNWNGSDATGLDRGIGAPLGYSIVGDLKKKGLSVSEAPSSEANLLKLLKGRVSAVALQTVTGDYFLANDARFVGVEKLEPPFKTKHYYLMISHQFKSSHPELAEKIWKIVAELRVKKLPELTSKYF